MFQIKQDTLKYPNGCIEFYPNVIAIICNSELEAIWIKPTILDK